MAHTTLKPEKRENLTSPNQSSCQDKSIKSPAPLSKIHQLHLTLLSSQHLLEEQISAMACCPPSCAIPSCCSTPQIGLGSSGATAGGLGLGLGSRGLGGGLQGGSMGGLLGGGVSSAELGILSGVIPQPINQIPPAEVVIQPPSFVVTIPGPILSASCDPVAVGGNTPCAAPGSGILGRPLALSRGLLGGRRGNVTLIPCNY